MKFCKVIKKFIIEIYKNVFLQSFPVAFNQNNYKHIKALNKKKNKKNI